MALGVGKGDIGLTSPISFLASANCIAELSGNFAVIIGRLRPDYHGEIVRSSVWVGAAKWSADPSA